MEYKLESDRKELSMLTFLVLASVIFTIIVLAVAFGGAIILIFGDIIVCGLIIWAIIKFIQSRKQA